MQQPDEDPLAAFIRRCEKKSRIPALKRWFRKLAEHEASEDGTRNGANRPSKPRKAKSIRSSRAGRAKAARPGREKSPKPKKGKQR